MLSISGCKLYEDTGFTSEGMEAVKEAYSNLNKSLEDQIVDKNIELRQYQDALTINIADKLFFKSGDAELKPEANTVIVITLYLWDC